MKAGLNPFGAALIVAGFWPAFDGGGLAGRDGCVVLEEELRPGGGGYDMLSPSLEAETGWRV